MKVHAPNIHPFAANGHFSLYYRPFFSLSSYPFCLFSLGLPMEQLRLFDFVDTAPTSKLLNGSYFQSILSTLQIDYGTGWVDHFGLALRHWFRQVNHQPIKTLSLFSGGGGLDIGFADAGFHSLEMVEIEKKYIKTLEANAASSKIFAGSKPVCQDICDYLPPKNLRVDFIIGGPPCQTFSAAGRRAAGVLGTTDPRGTLFEEYVRLLTLLKPKGFLFENVYGMMGAQEGDAWEAVKEAFKSAGYSIHFRILDTADYGVPQHRERIFIVGLREGVNEGKYLFPRPTHGPDSEDDEPYFTAGMAVAGADVSEATEGLGGQYGHLLAEIPPGLNYSFYTEKMGHPRPIFGWRSKFSDFLYKADPDAPVRTIKAQGGQYTGPFSWENRPLTVSEFKRLQTIPDEYLLVGTRQVGIEQIGNSVPPQMARMLALSILNQVFGVALPFELHSLAPSEPLGFRQRKRQKSGEYAQKAQVAIALIQTYPGEAQRASLLPSQQQVSRYLTPNFGWFTSPRANAASVRVHFHLDESAWRIDAQTLDQDIAFTNCYEMTIRPHLHEQWMVPVARVTLTGGDFSAQTFTALWKAFEEKLLEVTGVADLIQLSGYYQYAPKFWVDFRFHTPSSSVIWNLLSAIVQGSGVSKQLSADAFGTLFGFAPQEILPIFEQLRAMGYEVRNHHTNPQITPGDYLIPYAFPTLTPRSIQLKKKLRVPHE